MTDRPILFSTPMVRALLTSRKTQTRRIIKPQPFIDKMGNFCSPRKSGDHWNWGQHTDGRPCVRNFIADQIRIQKGDRLWVRESWKATGFCAFSKPSETRICSRFAYLADSEQLLRDAAIKWRPSIHMPRWASRITLTVTDVRVERLQEISEADALAEGAYVGKASHRVADDYTTMAVFGVWFFNARNWYANLWDRINGEGAWQANPWVVAYSFTVETGNIDKVAP